jgi:hypothetical protein
VVSPGRNPTRHAPNEQLSPVLVSSIGLAMPGSCDPNLFVASSAVFLASEFEAPTLASVALTIRVADDVRDLMTSR